MTHKSPELFTPQYWTDALIRKFHQGLAFGSTDGDMTGKEFIDYLPEDLAAKCRLAGVIIVHSLSAGYVARWRRGTAGFEREWRLGRTEEWPTHIENIMIIIEAELCKTTK